MYPDVSALADPDRVAFVMANSGATMTYGEYQAGANRIAHLLRAAGLTDGDHIAILMESGLPLLWVIGAAERTGLYFTLIDAKSSADEAAWIVNDSTAKLVVTSRQLSAVAAQLPRRCAGVDRWLMSDGPDGQDDFDSLATCMETFPATPVSGERLGISMMYSSGTTGRPKGIYRPMPDCDPRSQLPVFAAVADLYNLRPGLTFLQPAPMHHAGGQMPTALTTRLGGKTVIMERFDARRFLELVDEHQVTNTLVVPTMLARILALPDRVRSSASLSSLQCIVTGGAPCATSVKERIIDWLGPILVECYGGSEASGVTRCDSREALQRPGTVGQAKVGEVVIRGDDGSECPPHTVGEVWFRGATNFAYFNDPQKTAEAVDGDGTMSTMGDIGYVDEDGYLFLTDRAAFTIISGGVNVYPQEVENLLANHPDVVAVAVFGVPDDDLGETVKAVVQLRHDVVADDAMAEALIDFCRGRLARPKWPRSVDFTADLPHTSTGKVDKRRLRDAYLA